MTARVALSLLVVVALDGCGPRQRGGEPDIARVETWTLASPPYRGAKLSAHEGAVVRRVNEGETVQAGYVALETASGTERVICFDRIVRDGEMGRSHLEYVDSATGYRVHIRYSNYYGRFEDVSIEAGVRLTSDLAPRSVVSERE